MFCRFCGKQICDDSDFCAFCGKRVTEDMPSSAPPQSPPVPVSIAPATTPVSVAPEKKAHYRKSTSARALSVFSSLVFFCGLITFMYLLYEMYRVDLTERFFCYLGAAIVVIIIAVVVMFKKHAAENSKMHQLIALFFGFLLLIPSVGLKVIYEVTVETVRSHVSSSSFAHVKVTMDKEFWGINEAAVKDPYSYLVVDGKKHSNGSIFKITPGAFYTVEMGAGHLGGITTPADSGNATVQIAFGRLAGGGFEKTERIPFKHNGSSANVTYHFERVCSYWEVLANVMQ